MNIADWLHRVAQTNGNAPALLLGDQVVATYEDFARQAAGLATALQARGVGPGDRVGLFMKNCPDYLTVYYGVWTAGAAVVPINAKLHPKEAAFILQDSGASQVFVTPDLVSDLAEATDVPLTDISTDAFADMCAAPPLATVARNADDLAWLFYTSGTTGQPKGVQITHGMIAATSLCYPVDVDPVSVEDAAYYAAPMSHGAGIYAPIHVRMGARHICPVSGAFDPVELLDLSQAHGPTSMFMAPTMVRRLIDTAKASEKTGEGIKTIVYGGGPMYRADIEEAVNWFGPKFVQIYGQGECPMAISALSRAEVADRTHPNWRARLASVGRAQSQVEIAIAGADGVPLPSGEVGEIMVRGAPVMPGYWRNPEATKAALKDGWLMTGDVGRLDEDGYLTLQDRSKDVIISGGSNIYPREIEEVLLQHPTVHEVSVVGRPSPEWGEDVVAFVVCAPGADLDEAALDAQCLEQIARFKRPKAYIALPELPKNNYGKVLKTELRQRLESEA
ncbi:AMP-binding protein [Roseobacter sp. HKCCD9010]|uniref:class I adenylate-forming enzyme family protein n=1 Tax=unclassified Roseobacter TaxID=196798 RepID=UPI00149266FD|nr:MULTISPECIES: AMP-binding protein [unclassified Roseobacter]MBF9048680.1 AMP-binding protein [Rhodobacterales bacterium HKCCD4356]NNV10679.1 AMP-binding protein [Roseobacter sp. HKCCD7357]NNV14864.1 AMP-binding protein [Roseobacter sp. HKCCD8768]NNV24323.1 AMP-binding protein [Roseobacter sp. HKCCD8192]NNV28580.1 AMP-binding protein [Roseobacter sp. HKCCD9061]